LKRLDPDGGGLLTLQEQAASGLRDLHQELSRYAGRLDPDPDRLQQLEERVNLIQALRRKYGPTLDGVVAFGEQARQKLQNLEQRDAELARLNAELASLETELHRTGAELSAQRRKVIPRLRKAVTHQLADLGFKQSHFDVALTSETEVVDRPLPAASSGFDTVQFQFAPNPGEPPRPLRAIASSGEMARVMLALKTVLAAQDEIPVLIFDEVDANVGGETARTVGEKMGQLGAQRQVLCITHLAPVAAAAGAHYVVTKDLQQGRTLTGVRRLDREERVTELARMLGGQTPAARRHAEELLKP
jgi:DNA repair protein RecN (Recombination protein N)